MDDSSDGFLDHPGQDLVDEPDGGFVVDPSGVDQAGTPSSSRGPIRRVSIPTSRWMPTRESPAKARTTSYRFIGLNDTDLVNPVVTLNDPGRPAGQGETVPLETFLEAWEDLGNFLVTAHGSRTA